MSNVRFERAPEVPDEIDYESALQYVDDCLQYVSQKSIQDFDVICDASNNSAESIANKELHVDITFAPDELKYQILLRADGAVELVAKYARLGPNWFEVKDGSLGNAVEFI